MSAAASSIPSFNDARPLGLGDEAFVRELHDLLDRHDNLDRFRTVPAARTLQRGG